MSGQSERTGVMNFVAGERTDLIGSHPAQRAGRSGFGGAFGFNGTAPSRKEKSQRDFVMQPRVGPSRTGEELPWVDGGRNQNPNGVSSTWRGGRMQPRWGR